MAGLQSPTQGQVDSPEEELPPLAYQIWSQALDATPSGSSVMDTAHEMFASMGMTQSDAEVVEYHSPNDNGSNTDPMIIPPDAPGNLSPPPHGPPIISFVDDGTDPFYSLDTSWPTADTAATQAMYSLMALNSDITPDTFNMPGMDSDLFDDNALDNPHIASANNLQHMISQLSGNDGDRTNYPVRLFFRVWRSQWEVKNPYMPPISMLADGHGSIAKPYTITPSIIEKEGCDEQGIYWKRYAVRKEDAREVRRMTYKNHGNMGTKNKQLQDDQCSPRYKVDFSDETAPVLPSNSTFFKFRETHTLQEARYPHYQLRHNITAVSQNAIIYNRQRCPSLYMDPLTGQLHRDYSIVCYNPLSSTSEIIMSPNHIKKKDKDPVLDKVSTLSASHNVLVVGSMSGTYGMRSLLSAAHEPITTGIIAPATAIAMLESDYHLLENSTNHVHTILPRRSAHPHAIFSSNDRYIRILDCHTDTWLAKHLYTHPVNCSATSPDSRLRILVSDNAVPIVADAESGEVLAKLPGHTDHGFACAWAPDGVTMATGHQDGIVQIWDARKLSESIAKIPCEQGGVRGMTFSPLGGGQPVLVLAEPADFVHILDVTTLQKKQTIDFFGEIAGVSMTPDGRNLWVANADSGFGGLMEYERSTCGSFTGTGYGLSADTGYPKARRPWMDTDDLDSSLCHSDNDTLTTKLRPRLRLESDWDDIDSMNSHPLNHKTEGSRWRANLNLQELII